MITCCFDSWIWMKQIRSFLKTSRTHRRSKETCLSFKVRQTRRIALRKLSSSSTDWNLPSCQRKSPRDSNQFWRKVSTKRISASETSSCNRPSWVEKTRWTCLWTMFQTWTYCSRGFHHPSLTSSMTAFTRQTFVPPLSMYSGTKLIISESYNRNAPWSLRTRWMNSS